MRACSECFKKGVLTGVSKSESLYENGWFRIFYRCHVCKHFWMIKRKVEDVETEITS